MKKRWIASGPAAYARPTDFAPFPKALPDPDGRVNQWLENTTVVPLRAREWKSKTGWRVGPRVLNDTFWCWFDNGGGWYSLGKDRIRKPFQAGDLLLIPQGVEHTIGLHREQDIRHMIIHFHAHVFGSINLLSLLGFPSCVSGTANMSFGAASMALVREYSVQAPGWKRAMAGYIFDVLLHVIRHCGALFRPLAGAGLHQHLPRLLPVLEWIEQHLDDSSLTIGDLAQKVNVSEVYLRRLFQKATGLGPAAFIQRRRVERACMLLRLTPKSVKMIATETGFNELTFFYRVFGHWTGTTPIKYREGKKDRF